MDERRFAFSRRGLLLGLTALPAAIVPLPASALPAVPAGRIYDSRLVSVIINGKTFLPVSEPESLRPRAQGRGPFVIGGPTLEVSGG